MTALDTETHKGLAVLVATPTDFCEPWQWRNEDRFLKLCEWLRKRDREGFICWNADYDVQAILKWLPRSVCERLQRFSRARYKGLRLRFVPGKFFTVHNQKRRIVAVYDLMQFYACRLETAASKYLGEHKTDPGIPWDQILSVLKGRSARQRITLIDYCMQDARLVQRLYQKSKDNMTRIGVTFTRPVSCAAIASQKFGKAFTHDIPKEINRVFEKTFRGGRMECLRLGFFPRAYLYDLHSAYPSVIADLWEIPSTWAKIPKGQSPREDSVYAAVKTRFRIPQNIATGPVPTMGDGQLIYPTGVWEQWLDLQTFRLLEQAGHVQQVLGGWQGIWGGDKQPFAEIRELYTERIRRPENAWALKIVMNAWYGKLAQRIGRWKRTSINCGPETWWNNECWRRDEQWTKKTCFVYASAITAAIRKRLYTEINPSKVIFYATDGIALTEPQNDIQTGPGLGEWSECEVVSDLLVVGSGVYCYRDSLGNTRTKFRGFDVGLDLYRLLDSRTSVVEMTVKRNVTLSHALIQRDWARFNEIADVPRYLDVNFDRKRIWEKQRTGRALLNRTFESEPWRYYGEVTC